MEQTTSSQPIAWGARLSPAFKERLMAIAENLACDPSHLTACMAFETGERFSASIRNKTSGATGLIQFMPRTARALGTTTDALAVMSPEAQLDYVAHYFSPFKGRLRTLPDVYMAILWPRAVGEPEAFALFKAPSIAYKQNSGLDANRDGVVTKAEAAMKVQKKLIRGMKTGLIG